MYQVCQQRRRAELRERKLKDIIQSKESLSLPDLVPDDDASSDDESHHDDDRSIPDPHSRSEGDVGDGDGSGNSGPSFWQDHPRIADEPIDIEPIPDGIPAAAIPPAPNIIPEGADGDGATVNEGDPSRRSPRRRRARNIVNDTSPIGTRTRNHRKRGGRLRKQSRPNYKYSVLRDQQVPLAVRNAMRTAKKQSYKQRMNYIRQKGDELLDVERFFAY